MTACSTQPEILNLHYHRISLLVKALNKFDNKNEAAEKLGLSTRTINRYIKDHGIIQITNTQNRINYLPPEDFHQKFLRQTG